MRPSLNSIFAVGLALVAGYFFYTCAAGQFNFFTRHVAYQRERARGKIQITELNYLIPPFAPMAAFGRGEGRLDADQWKQYLEYFKKIAELMPQRWDVYVFLGYCFYDLGQKEQAAACFEKAAQLNPQCFWAYYNIALMAAKEGNCSVAAAGFARALNVPILETAKAMFTSKLYVDLQRDSVGFDQSFVEERLKAAYLNAYQLGALAGRCAQGASKEREDLRARASGAPLQIF